MVRSERSVTRRETGFLVIGLGFGLIFALLVVNEIFKSLNGGARISSYTIDSVLIVIPSSLLLSGVTLLLWKPKCTRTTLK